MVVVRGNLEPDPQTCSDRTRQGSGSRLTLCHVFHSHKRIIPFRRLTEGTGESHNAWQRLLAGESDNVCITSRAVFVSMKVAGTHAVLKTHSKSNGEEEYMASRSNSRDSSRLWHPFRSTQPMPRRPRTKRIVLYLKE